MGERVRFQYRIWSFGQPKKEFDSILLNLKDRHIHQPEGAETTMFSLALDNEYHVLIL